MRDFIMRNLGHIPVEPIQTEYARHLLNLFTGGNLRFAPTAHLTTQSSIPSQPSLTKAGGRRGLATTSHMNAPRSGRPLLPLLHNA